MRGLGPVRAIQHAARAAGRVPGRWVDILHLRAKAPFPPGALSNFAPHNVVIDGMTCISMAVFLRVRRSRTLRSSSASRGSAAPGAEHRARPRATACSGGRLADRLFHDYQALLGEPTTRPLSSRAHSAGGQRRPAWPPSFINSANQILAPRSWQTGISAPAWSACERDWDSHCVDATRTILRASSIVLGARQSNLTLPRQR